MRLNDRNDRPELSEKAIRSMRTDGWTQAAYKIKDIPLVLSNRSLHTKSKEKKHDTNSN